MRLVPLLTLFFLFCRIPFVYGYTLTIDIKEDEVNITKPHKVDVGQQDITIRIQASDMQGMPWSLKIFAYNDLQGEGAYIPASAISWKALSSPFIDGYVVKGVPQTLAEGNGDINTSGRIRFIFKDNYPSGHYTGQLRFVFSSP